VIFPRYVGAPRKNPSEGVIVFRMEAAICVRWLLTINTHISTLNTVWQNTTALLEILVEIPLYISNYFFEK
jgi:hypothetical protein